VIIICSNFTRRLNLGYLIVDSVNRLWFELWHATVVAAQELLSAQWLRCQIIPQDTASRIWMLLSSWKNCLGRRWRFNSVAWLGGQVEVLYVLDNGWWHSPAHLCYRWVIFLVQNEVLAFASVPRLLWGEAPYKFMHVRALSSSIDGLLFYLCRRNFDCIGLCRGLELLWLYRAVPRVSTYISDSYFLTFFTDVWCHLSRFFLRTAWLRLCQEALLATALLQWLKVLTLL